MKKANLKFWQVIQVFVLGVTALSAGNAWGAGTYNGGTGEPNNPYRIATAEDLNDIGDHPEDWSKHFFLVNDFGVGRIRDRLSFTSLAYTKGRRLFVLVSA